MSRVLYLSVILALAAAAYRLYIQPVLVIYGLGRVVQPLGTAGCTTVPALAACEKIVLHPPTGVLYAACSSSPASRAHWVPYFLQLNASGPSDDYLATYNPKTGAIARLEHTLPGVMVHGMDVVPSVSNPSELFIYVVNHRKPAEPQSAPLNGADSTIEIFKTTVGSTTLTHLHTVRNPVIITPNDIVGSSDGQSFFFTNDHSVKTGFIRHFGSVGLGPGSVGYCDINSGCKFAVPRIHGANGIVRSPNNDTFFVASSIMGGITVLERQNDNALLKTHTIPTDRPLDNLSIDEDGVVWAAGIPSALSTVKHIGNPAALVAPSSAHSIARNTGPGSFYGEKFKVTKVFEDDGSLASGTTSVVHDARRNLLFLHGIVSSHLTVCPL
ncbi:hypothetical protein DFH06DRAFT_1403430 [Mycena polygramma]|nr:hypothetical protein DFH06DRAFT_1403430 [Mycena polygramma]